MTRIGILVFLNTMVLCPSSPLSASARIALFTHSTVYRPCHVSMPTDRVYSISPRVTVTVTDGLLTHLLWTIIGTISFFVIPFPSPMHLVLSCVPLSDLTLPYASIAFRSMTHTQIHDSTPILYGSILFLS